MMLIWLLVDGEPLITDGNCVRLHRMGLIAQILEKFGHSIVFWSSTFDHYKKRFRVMKDVEIDVSLQYRIKLLHSCGYQKNISFKRIRHNKIVAKKFLAAAQKCQQPDIIFAAMPTIELAGAATEYGKTHDVPVVLDLRDMWPDIMVEVFPSFVQPFARIALFPLFQAMKKACKAAAALFGITDEFLSWGCEYAQRQRTKLDGVFPLAYTLEEPSAEEIKAASEYWQRLGLHQGSSDFVVVFIGSLQSSQPLENVIRAVGQLGAGVKLVIGGQSELLEKYQLLSKECSSNVIFPGWLDRGKIWSLLRLASVGIAPYILRKDFQSSIPNKAIEYLSAGLPVLTNLSGPLGRILKEGKCGYNFDNDDVSSIVTLMQSVLSDKKSLKKMSENAKTIYENNFVAEKVYAEMCSQLEMIANFKNSKLKS